MKRFVLSVLLSLWASMVVAQTGVTPMVSASAEATKVLRAAPGTLVGVEFVNQTGTAGFLLILNLTAAPADGAVTPVYCINIAANSTTAVTWALNPAAFNTGIVAVASSGANCFTKTTGVISGFFSGMVR